MTTKAETNSYLVPGESVHFLEAITLHTSDNGLGGGVVVSRGDTCVLTADLIRLNDFLRLVGDEDAQLTRWRRVIVRPGGWPEGVLTTRPGERSHDEAREAARQAAWREPNEATRAALLREVEQTFGRRVTSTQIAAYGGGR